MIFNKIPNSSDYGRMLFVVVVVFQSKGVRLVVVAIGPDAKKRKYQKVLHSIGGKNVFFVDEYETLGEVTSDIVSNKHFSPDHTTYSKMAKNTLFFCLCVNWPSLPLFEPKILLNSADAIEAMGAN